MVTSGPSGPVIGQRLADPQPVLAKGHATPPRSPRRPAIEGFRSANQQGPHPTIPGSVRPFEDQDQNRSQNGGPKQTR
jgi:hypothetical protein